MVLADRLSRFPSCRNNTPIETQQNIQHVQFNPDCLNIIRGAIERDPVHATVYCLNLNGCPDIIQDVPHVICHFYGTREELTIKYGEFAFFQNYKKGTSMIYMTAIKTSEGCNI